MDVSLKHTEQGGRATRLRSRGRGWGDRARGIGGHALRSQSLFPGRLLPGPLLPPHHRLRVPRVRRPCKAMGRSATRTRVLLRDWRTRRHGESVQGLHRTRSGKQPPCRTPSPSRAPVRVSIIGAGARWRRGSCPRLSTVSRFTDGCGTLPTFTLIAIRSSWVGLPDRFQIPYRRLGARISTAIYATRCRRRQAYLQSILSAAPFVPIEQALFTFPASSPSAVTPGHA